jgi:tRNA A37 threonylcarbamoyladenosine biosynthesis protein TsaE
MHDTKHIRRIISSSFKETMEIGKELAAELKPGDIIYLYGELGSGKTVS